MRGEDDGQGGDERGEEMMTQDDEMKRIVRKRKGTTREMLLRLLLVAFLPFHISETFSCEVSCPEDS